MTRLFYALCFLCLLMACSPSRKPDPAQPPPLALQQNDVSLKAAEPGEWLSMHPEPGQSFEAYIKDKPVRPTETKTKIYLQPIGEFTYAQQPILHYTADYLRAFFTLEVTTLPLLSEAAIPGLTRRYPNTSYEQLLTTDILNYLQNHMPTDALVVMAITAKDLYPGNYYNFVFGIARTHKRVGVSSIYRFSSELKMDSTDYAVCLRRLIKTSSHEMSHMLSLEHCTHAVCLMNGANSLPEADARPNRLCSECLTKLQWNLQFHVVARQKALSTFFRKHKINEDLVLAVKDESILSKDSVDHR